MRKRMMSGRVTSRAICGVLILGGMCSVVTAAEKPNILFILTDDQGYGDLGRHGHPVLETPNLDRLHDESVRFDNFYVSPSCSPTRAALMTGMHEFRNGVTHTLAPRENLFKDAVTVADLLKTAGYKTGFIGKWHIGKIEGYTPSERGFDWCSTNKMGPSKHFDVEMIRNGESRQTKGFREDVYFDESMTFIDEAGDQPFFLYLNPYSPHTPLDAPPNLIKKYSDQGLKDEHATYLAMIENIDENMGRLEAFLKKRGLEENTIIIFMNDNGVTVGLDVYNAGMRGCKATCWEGGTRAMSFWKWPGHWKPNTVHSLTAHLDVLPTLCELAGVETIPKKVQSELEGFSLLPLLNDKGWSHDDRTLFHCVGRWPSGTAASHKYAMTSIRKGNKLLVRSAECDDPKCEEHQSQCTTMRAVRKGLKTTTYANGTAQTHWGVTPKGQWVLYDVKDDPACEKDISTDHSELVSELLAEYETWWDELYPVMIARGGDAGDPEASKKAASKDRVNAATVAARRVGAAKGKPDGVSDEEIKMFARLDGDANGKVTKAEYLAVFAGAFPTTDANSDGILNAKEFPFLDSFKEGDKDADGKLTTEEFRAMYSSQFDQRDTNKDGVVTIDEM